MNNPVKVIIVGCGNVASHLASAITATSDFDLIAIANRTLENACNLVASIGNNCQAIAFDQISSLQPDIVIVSLADRAISEVVEQIGRLDSNPICLLTSGTIEKEMLLPLSSHVGILYPLQSFTKGNPVDFTKIPFFTEATDTETLALTDHLAHALSPKVYNADARCRATLHIAGVFSNNFVNILLEKTGQVLASKGLQLDVVEPLVRATIDKAFSIGPHAAMTGPARRGDTAVMQRQYEALTDELKPVYQILSDLITSTFK